MGKKSSKSTTNSNQTASTSTDVSQNASSTSTTGPSALALPYITQGSDAAISGYNQAQTNNNNILAQLNGQLPGVINSTTNNADLAAASQYNQDVLNGKYLTGNPYLDQQIALTNQDVINQTNGALGTRGLAGGSAAADILSRNLANNETTLRYNDYNTERGYQQAAVGNAASLSGANDNNINTLLAYLASLSKAGTANQDSGDALASALQALWGNATTTTQNSSASSHTSGTAQQSGTSSTETQNSLFNNLMSLIGAGTSAVKAFKS